MTDKKHTTELWVATGLVAVGDKLHVELHGFADAEGDKLTDAGWTLPAAKGWRAPVIGGVYRVTVTDAEKGSSFTSGPNGPVYHGLYGDAEASDRWRATAKAVQLAREARKLEKADRKLNGAFKQMEPLRQLYRSLGRDRRLALEVAMLQYLRG